MMHLLRLNRWAFITVIWILVLAGLFYLRAREVEPCAPGDIVCQEDQ